MWADWQKDILNWFPLTVITGAVAALARWFRPRRIVSFIAAVKEREVLMAHAEYERLSGLRWKAQADECREELDRLDKLVTRYRKGSDAGGGSSS